MKLAPHSTISPSFRANAAFSVANQFIGRETLWRISARISFSVSSIFWVIDERMGHEGARTRVRSSTAEMAGSIANSPMVWKGAVTGISRVVDAPSANARSSTWATGSRRPVNSTVLAP